MEDVLHLYAESYDPVRPVVCFDELPYQLVDDSRPPLPRTPGVPVRDDYEYVRQGTCNLFGCFEPLPGGGKSPSRHNAPRKTLPRRCGCWWTSGIPPRPSSGLCWTT